MYLIKSLSDIYNFLENIKRNGYFKKDIEITQILLESSIWEIEKKKYYFSYDDLFDVFYDCFQCLKEKIILASVLELQFKKDTLVLVYKRLDIIEKKFYNLVFDKNKKGVYINKQTIFNKGVLNEN